MTRSGEKVIQYVFHIWYSCVSELSFGSLYQANGKCVYTVYLHALCSRLERATAAIIHSIIHPRYVVFGDTKISIYADYFEAISFTAIA